MTTIMTTIMVHVSFGMEVVRSPSSGNSQIVGRSNDASHPSSHADRVGPPTGRTALKRATIDVVPTSLRIT